MNFNEWWENYRGFFDQHRDDAEAAWNAALAEIRSSMVSDKYRNLSSIHDRWEAGWNECVDEMAQRIDDLLKRETA